MVDFSLSPEQRALRSTVRNFAHDVLSTAPKLYEHLPTQTTRFRSTLPIYQSAVSAGLIKGQVPLPLGGTSTSMVDAAIVVEELYAVEPSIALTILGTGLGMTPLILAANAGQRDRLLKPFTIQEGETLAAFVHSEPGGTANWLRKGSPGLQTTAYQDGDEWVVNGEKVSCGGLTCSCHGKSHFHLHYRYHASYDTENLTCNSCGRPTPAAGTLGVRMCSVSCADKADRMNPRIRQSIHLRTY